MSGTYLRRILTIYDACILCIDAPVARWTAKFRGKADHDSSYLDNHLGGRGPSVYFPMPGCLAGLATVSAFRG